jgi:hypothetical protein
MDRDITLKLPEELAARAQAAGILTDEQIASLIEAELDRRQRRESLFADLETLHNLEPRLTPEEIEAEMKAFKQERAASRRANN